jgi:hypothetical protein
MEPQTAPEGGDRGPSLEPQTKKVEKPVLEKLEKWKPPGPGRTNEDHEQ